MISERAQDSTTRLLSIAPSRWHRVGLDSLKVMLKSGQDEAWAKILGLGDVLGLCFAQEEQCLGMQEKVSTGDISLSNPRTAVWPHPGGCPWSGDIC